MIKYVLEVTSVKKKFSELTVGKKDKDTWPELRYAFEVSHPKVSKLFLILFSTNESISKVWNTNKEVKLLNFKLDCQV
jgi:hypothetical protein